MLQSAHAPIGENTMTKEEFRETLLALGWNQTEFARKAGLTPPTANRYAMGEVDIPLWVESYLGMAMEIQRLYEAYVLPHGNAPRG